MVFWLAQNIYLIWDSWAQTRTHIHLTLSGPRVFFGHMKSGLVKEDEVDFTAQNVALSSIKHDLRSPTLKWAAQPLFGKVRSAPWSQP